MQSLYKTIAKNANTTLQDLTPAPEKKVITLQQCHNNNTAKWYY